MEVRKLPDLHSPLMGLLGTNAPEMRVFQTGLIPPWQPELPPVATKESTGQAVVGIQKLCGV